ncbi:amidohydrolase, partial [Acidobacteriota bacterium]
MFKKLLVFVSAVSLLFIIGCGKQSSVPSADLVIKNAKIVTIDKESPRAEAVAIKGEYILAVTSNENIDLYIEEGITTVIDAKGRLVVPGFNDAHCHFRGMNPDYVELRFVTDPKVITERVKEQVARSKPGELIRGGHWEHEEFYNQQWPTKELIDPVSPDNPVVLSRVDGHSSLVNSYVLKASGITKDTPDPFGGEIQKDPVTGEPTGIFKENARRLLMYGAVEVKRTPEQAEERRMREWQTAFDTAARLGITTIHLPPGNFEMYQKFRDMGKLTVRVFVGQPLTEDEEQLQQYAELQKQYPPDDNWIRFGFLKAFCDGTLGSATMLMYEPFADEPGKTGLAMMPYEELERKVVKADKMGFQIAIHAIGDKGVNWTLNMFEKAQQVNGVRDSRHRIEHVQFITSEDIPRFAELGVIPSMQAVAVLTEQRFAEKRVGYERCKNAYAWKKLLDAGAKVAFSTDYGVEPLDPLQGLYAGVTRKLRSGKGPSWFPDQCLTMEKTIE